jgi:predicted transcriptional regulator
MKQQIEFTCPHCKNKFNIDIYPVINLQSDTDLYDGLFSLDLFKIECENCKKVTMVEYDVLVVDMFKKYIIYLYKSGTLETFNNQKDKFINSLKNNENFIETFNQLKYTRIVRSLRELLEKLLIFDYDLNDKIIVKLKQQLFNDDIIDKHKYTHLNFEKLDGQNLIFTCYNLKDENVNPAELKLNFNYYNQIIDSLNGLPVDSEHFEYV